MPARLFSSPPSLSHQILSVFPTKCPLKLCLHFRCHGHSSHLILSICRGTMAFCLLSIPQLRFLLLTFSADISYVPNSDSTDTVSLYSTFCVHTAVRCYHGTFSTFHEWTISFHNPLPVVAAYVTL